MRAVCQMERRSKLYGVIPKVAPMVLCNQQAKNWIEEDAIWREKIQQAKKPMK